MPATLGRNRRVRAERRSRQRIADVIRPIAGGSTLVRLHFPIPDSSRQRRDAGFTRFRSRSASSFRVPISTLAAQPSHRCLKFAVVTSASSPRATSFFLTSTRARSGTQLDVPVHKHKVCSGRRFTMRDDRLALWRAVTRDPVRRAARIVRPWALRPGR